MKKRILLFFAILTGLFSFASAKNIPNPIIVLSPEFMISELYFDTPGKWFLEVNVHIPQEMTLDTVRMDSLIIETLSGSARFKPFPITQYDFMIVLTEDSLMDTLSINSCTNHISLISYSNAVDEMGHIYPFEGGSWSELFYGQTSPYYREIPNLNPGQSICAYTDWMHYKDNSPTIGLPNDTIDATGILYGKLYDYNFNPITSGVFRLGSTFGSFVPDSAGNYVTKMFARNNYANQIYQVDHGNMGISIDTFTYYTEPHGTKLKDIRVLTTFQRKNELFATDANITIVNAPNPFSEHTSFFISIPDYLKFNHGYIVVHDTWGKVVQQIPLVGKGKFQVEVDFGNAVPGLYSYSLVLDNKTYRNGQLIHTK